MQSGICPQCGAPLDESLGNLCPMCLMAQGTAEGPTEAHPDGMPELLRCDQLAAVFPEMEWLKMLGYGGMGAVYLARQKKLDRLVAVKVLHPDSANQPSFAERFEREARAMAKLSHPHIVTIHDFDHFEWDNGRESVRLYYIVMEYVEGADLRAVLDADQLQPNQALSLVQQICDALQFAHDAGVVHRDIKPENILLDVQGNVRIADFGLAKLAERAPQDLSLTATHQVVGTPRYMAPEQLSGRKEIDHRADLYSVGVVFYEMLTGELPLGRFELPSESGAYDQRMDEVVLRTLAREPAKRYQHASDIRDDVTALATKDLPPRRPSSPLYTPSKIQTTPPTAGRDSQSGEGMGWPDVPTSRAYCILILLLALAGVVGIWLPASHVRVQALGGGRAFPRAGRDPQAHSQSVESSFRFYRYTLSLLPLALSLALAVKSYGALITRKFLDRRRALLAIATGLSLVGCVLLTLHTLPELPNRDAPTWGGIDWSQYRRNYERYQDGYNPPEVVVSVASGVAVYLILGMSLVAFSVWELALFAAEDQRAADARGPLKTHAQQLRFMVWVYWGAMAALLAFLFHSIGWLEGPSHEFRTVLQWIGSGFTMGPRYVDLLILLTIGNGFACLLTTPALLLAAKRLEQGHSIALTRVACVMMSLPISPVVVLGWPSAVWCWLSLNANNIQSFIRRQSHTAAAVDERLALAGRRLAQCAVIHLSLGIMWVMLVALMFTVNAQDALSEQDALSSSPRNPRNIWMIAAFFGMMVVLTPVVLQRWSATALRRRASAPMAKIACWLAMLPIGPAWFIGLPVAIDTLCLFHEPIEGAKSIDEFFDAP